MTKVFLSSRARSDVVAMDELEMHRVFEALEQLDPTDARAISPEAGSGFGESWFVSFVDAGYLVVYRHLNAEEARQHDVANAVIVAALLDPFDYLGSEPLAGLRGQTITDD